MALGLFALEWNEWKRRNKKLNNKPIECDTYDDACYLSNCKLFHCRSWFFRFCAPCEPRTILGGLWSVFVLSACGSIVKVFILSSIDATAAAAAVALASNKGQCRCHSIFNTHAYALAKSTIFMFCHRLNTQLNWMLNNWNDSSTNRFINQTRRHIFQMNDHFTVFVSFLLQRCLYMASGDVLCHCCVHDLLAIRIR